MPLPKQSKLLQVQNMGTEIWFQGWWVGEFFLCSRNCKNLQLYDVGRAISSILWTDSQNIHLTGPGSSEFENLSVPLNEEERVCVWHPQNRKAYPDRHQKEEMTLIV